jgi:hypothetical protein
MKILTLRIPIPEGTESQAAQISNQGGVVKVRIAGRLCCETYFIVQSDITVEDQ